MKKLFKTIIIVILLFVFSLTVNAENNDYNEEYFSESIFSIAGDDVAETLNDFGIYSISAEEVYSVSFSEITKYFSETLNERLNSCLSDFMLMLGILIISTTVNTYFSKSDMTQTISVAVICIITITTLNPLLNMFLSTIKTSADFMLSFIPVFTLILSLSGNPASALSYNGITFAFAEGLSAFINYILINAIGTYFSVAICFSLNKIMNVNRLTNFINKTVSTTLGFLAGIFTGILTIKGVMSASVDTVSAKSTRFLLSSLVPVVGSSISDAYSSLIGSLNLIKGSVAAVAILVILIISLPAVLEGLICCVSFYSLSYLAEFFSAEQISSVFRIFYSGLRMLILFSIFQIFLLVISVGIMLTMKGGI